ncbi:MAG: M23 family metallopeptidase [Pseudoclavibacter sp.]
MKDDDIDHDAHRGLPSIGYALSQGRRASVGWEGLAGNHVYIESDGVVVALCHLQRASVEVRLGQRVRPGDAIARCGNSGNSTEPHLHIQVIDSVRIEHAHAVPLTFRGSLPRNGEVVSV